jgi:hypothetical protein
LVQKQQRKSRENEKNLPKTSLEQVNFYIKKIMDITTHLYTSYFQSLTQDLLFMTESDYPWKVVYLGKNRVEMEKQLPFSLASAQKMEVTHLLRNAIKTQDWYGEEELKSVQKYQILVDTLLQEVKNATAYKFGEIEIAVYILLELPNGEQLGLSTIAIET